MEQFHEMLRLIMSEGAQRPNRTGVDTVFVPGHMLKFDLKDGFPAITTKKMAFRAAVGELLGFFRGYDNAADFEKVGCKVWYQNANETKSWLDSPYRKGENDLGRIYGKQWTDWRDWREVGSQAEADALLARGFELLAHDTSRNVWVLRRGINQLEEALRMLKTDPTSRHILITGWRPDEREMQCIPVCHVDYMLLTDPNSNTLHLCLWQRSFDTFLAFNVALGALFLEIFAKLAGMKAGTFSHFIGDGHIYLNHFEQTEVLLSRDHYPQPRLVLGDSIAPIKDLSEIRGAFERILPEDIVLEGYHSHPAIKAPMAA